MAFLSALAFLHCGSIVYAVPEYSHWRDDGSLYLQSYDFTVDTVWRGTLASFLGSLAFGLGAITLGGRQAHRFFRQRVAFLRPEARKELLIVLGGLGTLGFVFTAIKLSFPLSQALFQVLRNLAIATVCLGPAMVLLIDQRRDYTGWIALAMVIPVVYLVVFGFTSFGFIAFSIFVSFWFCTLASPRMAPPLICVGVAGLIVVMLSAFVAWMSFRGRIREAIDGGRGSLSDRIDVIGEAIASIELLHPSNFNSLDWLNIRLNQNIFVGKAIEWHELYPYLKLYGEKLALIPFALIPRFLWPGKPMMGGSSMLEEHTGMIFSSRATFGMGPIIEWFINFGMPGIFFGMLLLGLVVRWIDIQASLSLQTFRFLDFARWFTAGIALVAPLTELFFMFNTALMSFLSLTALKHFVGRRVRQPESKLLSPSPRAR